MTSIQIKIPNNSLNLPATLFCGQAFRWQKNSERSKNDNNNNDYYEGVIFDIHVTVHISNGYLHCSTSSRVKQQEFIRLISSYFNLLIDPNEYFQFIRDTMPNIYPMVLPFYGLRILKQHPFETSISFMCAQGLGIGLIRRQVKFLCLQFGERINSKWHAFPAPEALSDAPLTDLARATNNHVSRAERIKMFSSAILSNELNFNSLAKSNYQQAKSILMTYSGIGHKIADCICLFGLGFTEAIPIDRHVKDYLEKLFRLHATTLSPSNYVALAKQARRFLGEKHAGIIQQLLFHYWRTIERQFPAL